MEFVTWKGLVYFTQCHGVQGFFGLYTFSKRINILLVYPLLHGGIEMSYK
jgi:hypothetical protein